MASAIVPAMLKRLVAIARTAAAAAPVLAMLLLPVLHATAAQPHEFAMEHAFAPVGKAADDASGHGSHHAGHAQTEDASHDSSKAPGPSCADMAGCPLHAQLPGPIVDLSRSVLPHAVGDGNSPALHAISRIADSPPPRSHA